MFIKKIGLIFLLVQYSSLFAQEIRFEHLTTELGLSNSAVNCIYQDKRGFIWIGTEDGLNKYDGYTFTVFKNKTDDTTSLSDNMIKYIYEDHQNRLWIATNDGGLNIFNRETEKFKRYTSKSNDPHSLLNNNTVYIFEDSHQKIWVMSSNAGLNLYNAKADNFVRIPLPVQGISREYSSTHIYEDKAYNFWIAGNTGLVKYSPKSGQIKKYLPEPNSTTFEANITNVIEPLTDSVFIVAGNSKIYEFDKTNESFRPINNNLSKHVNGYPVMYIKNDGPFLWIAAYNKGLIKYNKKNDQLICYTHNSGNPSSISSNIVNSIFKDQTGSFWIGTYLGGVNKFESVPKFNSYLKDQIVSAFHESGENTLWVGSQTSGLFKYNKKNAEWTNYQNNPLDKTSLSYNSALCVFEDKHNMLWVGTWEHGINRAKLSNTAGDGLKFEHLLGKESVLCITPDLQNRLWMGTNNYLFVYDRTNNQFIKFEGNPNIPASFGHASVQSINTDAHGNLWLGTWNGLHHAILPKNQDPTPKSVKFISYYNNLQNKNSISDNRVLSVCISKNGTIWAGTYAGGINKLVINSANDSLYTCKRYLVEDGLPNNCVFGIQEDEKGLLWISTNKGFASFDPKTEIFIPYNKSDGLQGEDFQWRSSYKNKQGTMYFGGSTGFTSFLPSKIEHNTYKPPVFITGFSIFNKPVNVGEANSPLKTSISTSREITIRYDQSMISFDFAALNYILSNKNKYKYRMTGFDKDWVFAGTQRRATYTNLDPGTYFFRVCASNNDGLWNNDGTSIRIVVLPPWWKTWWFRTLLSAFIFIVVYSFYLYRISTLKKQKIKLQIMVDEQTAEILQQKDELETFNEELTSTNEELYYQRKELETINEELLSANEELYSQREQLETTLNSLKETQKHLIQSEKMASLGTLASGVAHEINNPLNFINGGIYGLENYIEDFAKDHLENISPFLSSMHAGIDRATNIVKSLNMFSRQSDATNEKCDLELIINNCLIILKNQYDSRITIEKQFTTDTYTLFCNNGKLHQVIINLLSNAIQAIENKGTITLSTYIENKMICLSVKDSGEGIKDEHLSKIFDPFFTTKEPGKGTGLGLSISYDIIKGFNGTINIKSEENIGTTFTIALPIE